MAGGTNEPLPIGTVVRERYLIENTVGRGGLGTVYQVRDEVYGKGNVFALKELIDQSSGARKQFELESQWLQSLDHNSIPKVREHFGWHDRLYLVMDFVDGDNLEQKLSRLGGRPMAEQQVIAWILPICGALQYLHTRIPPILHRDVKPANIIVTPTGHPVLVDLGIAKEHLPGAGRTATFVRKAGTEGYAPPEQYTAAGQTGPWSDVYGLGATLYQLLTGGIPPTAVERVALDHKLLSPRAINPNISAQTDGVIRKALEIRPADRFQSVAEFARALAGQPFTPAVERGASPPLPYPSVPPNYSARQDFARSAPGATSPMPVSSPTPGGVHARRPGDPAATRPMSTGALPTQPRPAINRAALETPAPADVASADWKSSRDNDSATSDDGKRRRWFRSPVLLSAGLLVVIALGVFLGLTAIHNLTPPDRSTPNATITGYFTALRGRNYSRAYDYLTNSQTNITDRASVLDSLAADDDHYGRVLSARIVSIENDSGGKVAAQVAVTRALAPNTPRTYAIELSQYSGNTWLIDGIATS
ncbi:MAG TPA: protein kinase [Ktedonobacterales bacterium]|nr:protein kinase [Ktedonobacterales bacterium]